MAYFQEPIHDTTARTTATSGVEGRLRVDANGMKKKKKKILKDIIKKNTIEKI